MVKLQHGDSGKFSGADALRSEGLSSQVATLTEVRTEAQLLLALGISEEPGPRVTQTLRALLLTAEASGSKAFVQTNENGSWAIVAPDRAAIVAHRTEIAEIDALQSMINPGKIYGQKYAVNEFALVTGVADGLIETDEKGSGPSLMRGSSQILAYKDIEASKSTIYFDLTARAFELKPENKGATDAVANGVIIIDDRKSVNAVETMYAASWKNLPRNMAAERSPGYYTEQFGK